ncbi:hypothetical protein LCGC14_1752520 [marine sediment metagenome]|uniref:Uncharacterized protein n=1 Tax=marine sediment metagenome TaxID=412755 RepID=A0A0F9K2W0_9ZZZZ
MRYFVSYFHKSDTEWGFGTLFVTMNSPISTVEHIRKIGLGADDGENVVLSFIEVPDLPTEEDSHPE